MLDGAKSNRKTLYSTLQSIKMGAYVDYLWLILIIFYKFSIVLIANEFLHATIVKLLTSS